MRSILCVSVLASLHLAVPSSAEAKSVKTVGYRYAEVWSTAIRLLRVDNNFTIKDKDKDSGYILFVYPGDGRYKKCPGALELVQIPEAQDQPVRVRVQLEIEHQPSYVAVHLLEKLETKLRVEQGPPRSPRPNPSPPPKKTDPEPPKE